MVLLALDVGGEGASTFSTFSAPSAGITPSVNMRLLSPTAFAYSSGSPPAYSAGILAAISCALCVSIQRSVFTRALASFCTVALFFWT